MIDFVKLMKIVPDEGTLVLTFKKSGDKLVVCYAAKHKGKEDDKEYRPVVVTGTVEELNSEWNDQIEEISKNERLLVSSDISAKLNKRKRETHKSLTDKSSSGAKKKKSSSDKGSGDNLFSKNRKKTAGTVEKNEKGADEAANLESTENKGNDQSQDVSSQQSDDTSHESSSDGDSEKQESPSKEKTIGMF